MGNNENLKAAIQDVIKQNGTNAITGLIMQNALLSIINQFGTGGVFRGVAVPSTNPGTSDVNSFYVANQNGTYVNFGGFVNTENRTVFFSNATGIWQVVAVFNVKGRDANLGDWSASKTYTWVSDGEQYVTHAGKLWAIAANQTATGTDVPGVSSKWVPKVEGAKVVNLKSRDSQDAAGVDLFTKTIDGSWTGETAFQQNVVVNYVKGSSGVMGANISDVTSGGVARGYVEISGSDLIGGASYFIQSAVDGMPTNVPLFMFTNADNRISVLAVPNIGVNAINGGIIVTAPNPLGATTKLFVNTKDRNDPRFKIARITGYTKGIEQRLQDQEALKSIIDRSGSSILMQEGDILNGNYTLFEGRPANNGILDGDTAYKTTDFLPVIPGNKYAATRYNNRTGALISATANHFYDANKNAVTNIQQQNTVAPYNASFIRITFTNANAAGFSNAEFSMVLNEANQIAFMADPQKIFSGKRNVLSNDTFLGLKNIYPDILKYTHLDKNLLVIGDSGTENYDAIGAGNHVRMLRDRFGFKNVYRMCQGGKSYGDLQSILTYSMGNGLKYIKLPSEATIETVDVCVLFLGQNSRSTVSGALGSGNPIGTINDPASIDPATSTIYGQVKYWVEWLLGKNPKMRIYLSSTWKSYADGESDTSAANNRLRQIADVNKNVALFYGMPYIPVFEECWSVYNFTQYMRIPDKLHFSYEVRENNGIAGVQRIFQIMSHYMQV